MVEAIEFWHSYPYTSWVFSLYTLILCFMQRITIQGIKNDPWFQRNYVTVKYGEDEEVNLDDVRAVFDDIEVGPYFPPFCNNLLFLLEVAQC